VGKVSEILAGRKPRVKSIRLILDGTAENELERVRTELSNAKRLDKEAEGMETLSSASLVPDAEERYKEIEAGILEGAVVFTFKAVGRKTLETIRAEHPPTEDQWEIYRERSKANPLVQPPTFDPDGIAPQLIQAALVDPELSLEEATQLWDELSDGEAAQIYDAAWEVSMEAASIPLSATGIGGIGDSDASSIMRQVMESLGPSLPDA
jgi:hypothetical protein